MTEPQKETKKICPIFHRREDYNGYCVKEKCMFFRKKNNYHSCWILDGFIGLARTWEIRE